jgi:hypothetical protein
MSELSRIVPKQDADARLRSKTSTHDSEARHAVTSCGVWGQTAKYVIDKHPRLCFAKRGIANETGGVVGGLGVNSTAPVFTVVGAPGLRVLLQVIDVTKLDKSFELVAECSNLADACMNEDTMTTCNRLKSDNGCKSELFYATEPCHFFCLLGRFK